MTLSDMRSTVQLRVNGTAHSVTVGLDETLLDVLRRELKLFGAREGCGIGMCGACTVIVNGKPMSACLMLSESLGGFGHHHNRGAR